MMKPFLRRPSQMMEVLNWNAAALGLTARPGCPTPPTRLLSFNWNCTAALPTLARTLENSPLLYDGQNESHYQTKKEPAHSTAQEMGTHGPSRYPDTSTHAPQANGWWWWTSEHLHHNQGPSGRHYGELFLKPFSLQISLLLLTLLCL